jgi:hypothetical protein
MANEPLEVGRVSPEWIAIKPKNWEYKLEVVSEGFQESLLNEQGAKGWELVQVLLLEKREEVGQVFQLFFKRPKS